MTMSGYRAEASLYRSSGQYRAALAAGFLPLGGAFPQQVWPRDCDGCCANACSGRTGYLACVYTCEQGGYVCDSGTTNCQPLCTAVCP
jgi:hypothetical protein